jgi:hypothetical protein
LLQENFATLDNRELFYFPKIKAHSTYTIVEDGLLKAESQASASARMLYE